MNCFNEKPFSSISHPLPIYGLNLETFSPSLFTEKPNYSEALEALGSLAQKVKALDDDDTTEPSGRKRVSSEAATSDSTEAKKPRTTSGSESTAAKEAVVKKSLQKISRKVIPFHHGCLFFVNF